MSTDDARWDGDVVVAGTFTVDGSLDAITFTLDLGNVRSISVVTTITSYIASNISAISGEKVSQRCGEFASAVFV